MIGMGLVGILELLKMVQMLRNIIGELGLEHMKL
jgi:hypothetical protein